MKLLHILLFFATTMVAMVAMDATAAETLTVCGDTVTSSGKVTPNALKSGSITYDQDTNTLTLDNAVIDDETKTTSIYTSINGLTIMVVGHCTITTGGNGIKCDSRTIIDGGEHVNGSLSVTCTNSSYAPIWANGDIGLGLDICNLYLTVTGGSYGIYGRGSANTGDIYSYAKLNISTVDMEVNTDSGNGAIREFASLRYDSSKLISGAFNKSKRGICDTNINLLNKVEFKPQLTVGNIMVHTYADNTPSLNPIGMSEGTITYSKSDSTLTLDGVRYKAYDRFVNNLYYGELHVRIIGSNHIDNSGNYCIFTKYSTTFEGEAPTYSDNHLAVDNSYGAIYLWPNDNNQSITLRNATFTLTATTVPLCSAVTSYKTGLNIDSCRVQATGNINKAIEFTTCTMTHCGVNTAQTPAFFNSAKKAFTGLNGIMAQKVLIDVPATSYPLTVLGTPVTNLNKSNILVDGMTAGRIYSGTYNTYYLKDVKITAPEGNDNPGVEIGADASQHRETTAVEPTCTISLLGENTITTNGSVFQLGHTVSFTGTGSFEGTSKASHGIITGKGANVTLETSGHFFIHAAKYGYYGDGSACEDTLTMKKATKDIYGYGFQGTEGAICNVRNLMLNNMDYAGDNGNYYFDACYFDDMCVRQNGGDIAKGSKRVAFYSIQEKLGLTVGGKEVHRVHASRNIRIAIGSPYITAGGANAAVYDPASKKLTLTNATIDTGSEDMTCIANHGLGGLTVSVNGTNTLKNTGTSNHGTFFISQKTTVSSETRDFKSTLHCIGGDTGGKGIYLVGDYPILSVQDKAVVRASGSHIGIGGDNDGKYGETLNVNDASVFVTSGAIAGLKNFSMNSCSIVIPSGGSFNADAHCIVTGEGDKVDKVLILSDNDKITAIDAVEVNHDTGVRHIYDAIGRQLEGARQGLNIIRMKDGSVRKVMVK